MLWDWSNVDACCIKHYKTLFLYLVLYLYLSLIVIMIVIIYTVLSHTIQY